MCSDPIFKSPEWRNLLDGIGRDSMAVSADCLLSFSAAREALHEAPAGDIPVSILHKAEALMHQLKQHGVRFRVFLTLVASEAASLMPAADGKHALIRELLRVHLLTTLPLADGVGFDYHEYIRLPPRPCATAGVARILSSTVAVARGVIHDAPPQVQHLWHSSWVDYARGTAPSAVAMLANGDGCHTVADVAAWAEEGVEAPALSPALTALSAYSVVHR